MTSPARMAAFQALTAIADQRADLPTALAASRQALGDARDRALAADIVAGTLRWQRSLDHLIAHYAGRPLDRLDPPIVILLRLSLYQLLHLDRVPAAAVVDDAVDLTRAARKSSAAGFVNAVLRATIRQRHRLPLPSRPDDAADRAAALAYLGITLAHPEWLVSRWLDRVGFEAAERWARFNNETPALTIRANRLRLTRDQLQGALAREEVETEPTRHAPDGLVVTAGNPLAAAPRGDFFVQDEASQLVALLVGARPGERVLDLCAAPGGKATALAADMGDAGLIVACDVRPRRLRLLRATVRQSGAGSIRVLQAPAEGPLPFAAVFDRVLVDAPCSGLGTVRRDPDIKWRRREADLAALAVRQQRLLERAAAVVRPGGHLVYATCSSEPEENDAVVEHFLATQPGFGRAAAPSAHAAALAPLLDEQGVLRTRPDVDGLEAFFAAPLRRER